MPTYSLPFQVKVLKPGRGLSTHTPAFISQYLPGEQGLDSEHLPLSLNPINISIISILVTGLPCVTPIFANKFRKSIADIKPNASLLGIPIGLGPGGGVIGPSPCS